MPDGPSIEERSLFASASVLARKAVPATAIGERLGLAVPGGPGWVQGSDLLMIGTGPGAWLAAKDSDDPLWARALAARLEGLAAVADQSSAYRIWRISGPGARSLLQKGLPLDLHPDCFTTGSAAQSLIAHIPVLVWQLDEGPTFDVAAPRSFGASLERWLDRGREAPHG